MNTNACGDRYPFHYTAAGTACHGHNTYFLYVEPTCHGCAGKGWVSPNYGVAAICPVCKGTGKPAYPPPRWWVAPPGTFQPYGRRDYEEVLR